MSRASSESESSRTSTPEPSTPNTDQVLQTPELLLRILEHIGSRSALRNAALVCRAWHPWAREARWTTCRTSLKEVIAYAEMGSNNLEGNDWATNEDDMILRRFFHCTQKVTSLMWYYRPFPSKIWELFAKAPQEQQRSLFPRLRSLTVHFNDRGTAFSAAGIVGPAFVEAFGSLPITGQNGLRLLKSICSLESRIRSLDVKLKGAPRPPDFSLFPELRSLTYASSRISLAAYSGLTLCPFLEDLILENAEAFGDADEASQQEYAFPSLQNLRFDVHGSNLFVPNVILASSLPALRSFDIAAQVYPNTVTDAIVRHLRRRSPMEKIVLSWNHLNVLQLQTHLSFPTLTSLHLVACHGMELDNDTFDLLTMEMTGLHTLFLRSYPLDVQSVHLTEKSFLSLARHAQSLVRLTITINASQYDPKAPHPTSCSFPHLTSLDLTVHLDNHNVRRFPGFVASLTPTLRYLRVDVWKPNHEGFGDPEMGFRTDYWAYRRMID